MALATKKSNELDSRASDSRDTFVDYPAPGGGTVRVMDAQVLSDALKWSNTTIKETISKIKQNRGAPDLDKALDPADKPR